MTVVRKQPDWPAGRILRLAHRSQVLQGNPWGDPSERDLNVYLPPGYDESGAPYIALWDLAAFTNSGQGHLNWRNHGETLAQRLDRLIHEQRLPPVVVPMPDCYTSLGGNQYLNSSAVGRYADYLVDELLPLLGERVNVVGSRHGRGLFGKSSGGYGALHHAMHYPQAWGGLASHAGDCGFDLVYRPAFPATCQLLAEHGGDPQRFIEVFWGKRLLSGRDFEALMTLAMAASYDPDEQNPDNIQLPFDLHTCRLDEQRWAHWLAHDPLQLVARHAAALNSMHCIYLDVGSRDQYNLQFGTRALSAELEKHGISHYFEEFDGTHSQLDWRLDHSLPRLAGSLVKAVQDNGGPPPMTAGDTT